MVENLVVVLGSCSVDFTTYAERLPGPGETLHGYKFKTSHGGKGANQCVAAAKLGAKTAMVAKVGDDMWGSKYIKYFNDSGINTTFMSEAANSSTGIAQINVSKAGENQIVIVAGSNNCLSIEEVENAKDIITNASVLVCQLETPVESTERAFEICKGIKILNAAPALPNISRKLLSLTTILCVNEPEAAAITDRTVESPSDIAQAMKLLLGFGCETVIITLGANGAVYATQSDPTPVHVLCDKVVPVDTTGAGDAFIGALAALLAVNSTPLSRVIGASCSVASLSVTREGTQESYLAADIDVLMNKDYQIKKLL